MRRVIRSVAACLALLCGVISAILLVIWLVGEPRVRCIRINGESAAALSDDGTWLAALNRIGSNPERRISESILVSDADRGKELLTLAKAGEFFCEVFSVPGNDQLISLSIDRAGGALMVLSLTYWDSKTWRQLHSTTLAQDFRVLAYNRFVVSPDGDRLYLVSYLPTGARRRMPAEYQWPGTITCWELPSGNKLFTVEDDLEPAMRLASLVFSGDGTKMAAICEPRMIQAWDAVTGDERYKLSEVDAQQLAFASDGNLAASFRDGSVRFWNLATGAEASRVNVPLLDNKRASIVLSPDSRRLAVSDDQRVIEIWDAAGGKVLHRFQWEAEGPDIWTNDIAFSPDGRFLAAVGREFSGTTFEWRNYDGHIRVWDVADGKLIHHSTFDGGRGSHRLIFGRDGQSLLVVSEQCITLCHIAHGRP